MSCKKCEYSGELLEETFCPNCHNRSTLEEVDPPDAVKMMIRKILNRPYMDISKVVRRFFKVNFDDIGYKVSQELKIQHACYSCGKLFTPKDKFTACCSEKCRIKHEFS